MPILGNVITGKPRMDLFSARLINGNIITGMVGFEQKDNHLRLLKC